MIALQKNAEAFARHFNAPEEKAKWEKFGKEMQNKGLALEEKFNSPEEQAKWKQLTDSMSKLSVVINKRLNSPEFQAQMKKLNENLKLKSKELQLMMLPPEVPDAPAAPDGPEPITMRLDMKYELESPESATLKSSDAYQKLRKDFEAKVEKLKKKQEKKKW